MTHAADLTGHYWGNERITGPSHDVVIGPLVRGSGNTKRTRPVRHRGGA